MARYVKLGEALGGKAWRRRLRTLREFAKAWPLLSACLVTFVIGWVTARAFGVGLSDDWLNRLLTTTITASTESIQFMSPSGRESEWSLPPGALTIIGHDVAASCETVGLESVCNTNGNTRLVIDGTAQLTFRSTAGGGWAISATDIDGGSIDVAVHDANDRLVARTEQYLEFIASARGGGIRFPFVADASIIGADLRQSSTIDGTSDDFWQPMLLSGNVLMVAENKPGREKYEVLNESLDPGDILHIGELSGDSTSINRNAIWGVLSLVESSNSLQQGAVTIDVVLHTSIKKLAVTRFGAPEGHEISASNWSIVHRWPNGQSFWISLVSIILITTFVFEIRGLFATNQK